MTNAEWKSLIAEEFGVSKSLAKEMFHAMLATKRSKSGFYPLKAGSDSFCPICCFRVKNLQDVCSACGAFLKWEDEVE